MNSSMDPLENGEALVQEFKKGSQEEFAFYFRYYYRPLCYFAAQLVEGSSEAEDIVKDSFIKLWNNRDNFNDPNYIKAFLYTTTRNACLNHLRHRQVKNTYRKEMTYREGAGEKEQVLQQMIRAELMEEIYHEIEKLPEKQRQVFKLAYFEELKNNEIAQQMNISIFTVKQHKAKALTTLRMRFTDKQLALFLLFVTGGLFS
jgi:RNA polymerase sigma-70 factor (ECF subfamily)